MHGLGLAMFSSGHCTRRQWLTHGPSRSISTTPWQEQDGCPQETQIYLISTSQSMAQQFPPLRRDVLALDVHGMSTSRQPSRTHSIVKSQIEHLEVKQLNELSVSLNEIAMPSSILPNHRWMDLPRPCLQRLTSSPHRHKTASYPSASHHPPPRS